MQPTPQVVQDTHLAILWLIPQLDKFPRNRRFTLGERIESGLLAVLEQLTCACYSQQKTLPLTEANLKLAIVRHLWRLAFELKVIPGKQYEHGARLLVSIGSQIGGWLKH